MFDIATTEDKILFAITNNYMFYRRKRKCTEIFEECISKPFKSFIMTDLNLELKYARQDKDTSSIKELIKEGAIPSKKRPLSEISGGHDEQIRSERDIINDLNEKLIKATKKGNLEKIKKLLKKGADINCKEKCNKNSFKVKSEYVLDNYCMFGNYDYDEKNDIFYGETEDYDYFLCEKGYFSYENTPLYIASEKGCVKVVNFLLENGADVNLTNKLKMTPLIISSCLGHVNIVKELLKYKANIFLKDIYYNALESAIINKKISIMKILIPLNVPIDKNIENILKRNFGFGIFDDIPKRLIKIVKMIRQYKNNRSIFPLLKTSLPQALVRELKKFL